MIKSPSAIGKPSSVKVFSERLIRYLKVGSFLHAMALCGLILTTLCFKISVEFLSEGSFFVGGLWFLICIAIFTMPFFAQFDAYGRYQNYKQIKDSFYVMGFDQRLIKPFMYSKCQRDAVLIAAEDLNCQDEVRDYFYQKGYRWYHILPDAFMKNPLVLFYGLFWKRILFTKHYQLQNFYW